MKKILVSIMLALFISIPLFSTESMAASSDFVVKNGVLTKYKGSAKYVKIPSKVKTIGNSAFAYNSNVVSIKIPTSVKIIKDRAFLCSNIKSITIPKNVKKVGNYTFLRCYNLKKIIVNKENKYYRSKDGCLFNKNESKLIAYPIGKTSKKYTVPSSVKTIGNYAFAYGGPSIINLPSNLENIEEYAFAANDNLDHLIIPEGVKSLNSLMFINCRGLKYVKIPRSVVFIKKGIFENSGSWVYGTYIKGYTDSYAEVFAEKYNIEFEAID